ncbi:MAG: ATP-dependent Clp protease proteolytic subunit [Armatimonadetes bacterium]|nr:ATP-dependent Clp protease proteolytic subunit [Armatimonadota bacterium]
MDIFFSLIWLFFILSALVPLFKQRRIQLERYRLIRQLEKERKSRVITLIHRQEALSILGIPIVRYVTVEDSEQVLRAIRLTPPDLPIDLVVHTPGGLLLAAEQIAMALKRHKAKVTVFVPHYAMSGGTLIALAADEIVMDPNAVLGPVDPQLQEYPASSILEAVKIKDKNELEDKTLILADIARKAIHQVRESVYCLLKENMDEEKARQLARVLSEGTWTHDYPISVTEARELGLPVSEELPETIYYLMELYPQPVQRRPSVEYIPVPYRRESEPPHGK